MIRNAFIEIQACMWPVVTFFHHDTPRSGPSTWSRYRGISTLHYNYFYKKKRSGVTGPEEVNSIVKEARRNLSIGKSWISCGDTRLLVYYA